MTPWNDLKQRSSNDKVHLETQRIAKRFFGKLCGKEKQKAKIFEQIGVFTEWVVRFLEN